MDAIAPSRPCGVLSTLYVHLSSEGEFSSPRVKKITICVQSQTVKTTRSRYYSDWRDVLKSSQQ